MQTFVNININKLNFSDSDCGRVRTIDFDGKKFEAGGSVLHPANKHVSSIMKEYRLRKTNLPSRIPSILGAGR